MPHRFVPVESDSGCRRLPRPDHPGGEDPVEQGLHQGGTEEGGAIVALKAHAQGFFQGCAHRSEGRRVAGYFDSCQAVPGVGRQQPGHVLGLGQRNRMGQHPAQVLAQAGADLSGEGPWPIQPCVEFRIRSRNPEGFQSYRLARRILPHQHKVPGIGDQHPPVAIPVAAHLIAGSGEPGVTGHRLDLNHAAFRLLSRLRFPFLHLLGRVQAKVGMTGALIGQLLHTEHLGPERPSHRVQQVSQRHVQGTLVGCAAGSAHQTQFSEVSLDGLGEIVIRH